MSDPVDVVAAAISLRVLDPNLAKDIAADVLYALDLNGFGSPRERSDPDSHGPS